MLLVRLALKNPYVVIVLVLGIVVLGLTVLTRIPVDLLPIFKTPAVQIVTFYPGMPAEVMEKDITSRLERWTGQSIGIEHQEAKSMIGVSIVKDFFREDISPEAAMSQVTMYAMSDLFYLPPGTIPPMVMPFDPTATIPLCLLSVSSPTMDETELYDVAYFELRNRLQGVPGVIAPAVYGGKLRRVLAYVDRDALQARNLSSLDVARALRESNVLIPTGNAKFGSLDYQIIANGMVSTVGEMNDFPIRFTDNGGPLLLRDVASAQDSSQIQTNVVRVDGKRQVYIPVYRQPGSNTIRIVEGVKEQISAIQSRLPAGINLDVVLDQSIYVRQSIRNLVEEGIIGAALAALMILVFLRSVRSTSFVLVAIPLSILFAFIGLYFLGQSVNAMTLGGLALAVGLLIDQSIIVLENVSRHVEMGKPAGQAVLDAAREVWRPVLVITLTIVVVFFPVAFLSGIGKFLFTPLALAVAFAMTASYVVAMMVMPVLCSRFLAKRDPSVTSGRERGLFGLFARGYGAIAEGYRRLLSRLLRWRIAVVLLTAIGFAASLLLLPRIGSELFPRVDSGQMLVRVRAPSGTRVEKTEEMLVAVEAAIRQLLPENEIVKMITNIGVLNDWPAAYTPNSGPSDAFVNLQLSDRRQRTAQETADFLRHELPPRFPGVEFSFDTSGMLTAALNQGLPAPIDVQVEGNKLDVAMGVATELRDRIARIGGAVDVRIQQRLDYPTLGVDVDRVKAARLGLTQQDVVKNVVTAVNSSINFDPAFWIDPGNGNHYFLGAQYPEAAIVDLDTIRNVPITGRGSKQPTLLRNIAEFSRSTAPSEVTHRNITRVIDVYADVHGRDIGAVGGEVDAVIDDVQRAGLVPSGYFVHSRGEMASMHESFSSLGFGLLLAAVLVYLVLIVEFRSLLDPLIVLFAIPLGFVGVLAMLWLTGTPFSIQSLMGVIMMVGIVVSFSIHIVDFANRIHEAEKKPRDEAVVLASLQRLRPILMTSFAAVLGLVPMAIAGGANIPLARAVIGGVLASALLTLVVVPVLYSLFKRADSTGAKEIAA
ncbi:MAG: efflux RND transporter permease subunit [Planctomycetes bacterium]|nr:efflux RND transporter permease subunit [Planctomycetota bacterium]